MFLHHLYTSKPHLEMYRNSFVFSGSSVWNSLHNNNNNNNNNEEENAEPRHHGHDSKLHAELLTLQYSNPPSNLHDRCAYLLE